MRRLLRSWTSLVAVSASLLLYLFLVMNSGSDFKATPVQNGFLATTYNASDVSRAPKETKRLAKFPESKRQLNPSPQNSRTKVLANGTPVKYAHPSKEKPTVRPYFNPSALVPGSQPKLSEVRQVVFAKVHKAASSTVQNILLRFAIARRLSVLLPTGITGITETGSRVVRVVPKPKNKPFDILCHHIIYNEAELSKYFSESAVRVAIIREPFDHVLSALKYYTTVFPSEQTKAGLKMYPQDPINGFLNHPEYFYRPVPRAGPAGSYINNRMSIDLGFDMNKFELGKHNQSKIQDFLKRLEKQFDLMLISDYFDESMVLLRRYLRWSMKDIIYIKVNTAKQNTDDSMWNKKPVLNATTSQVIRKWNSIDYSLYEHFLPIFLKKIENEPLLKAEVGAFRTIQEDVLKYCLNSTSPASLEIPKSVWTNKFTISRLDCHLMLKSERELLVVARRLQRKY